MVGVVGFICLMLCVVIVCFVEGFVEFVVKVKD